MELTREVNMDLDSAEKKLFAPSILLRLTVDGEVDPVTGFICNIKTLDDVVRQEASPPWRSDSVTGDNATIEQLLIQLAERIEGEFPTNVSPLRLEIIISPQVSFAVNFGESKMVSLTRRFEFAAAHRLTASALKDDEVEAVFGKCANPSGHGHNYVLDVTVKEMQKSEGGRIIRTADMDAIVRERVIDRFDHKFLNLDCEEFAGINPTMENIVRVIWEKLNGAFDGATLENLRLHETSRSWVDYRGD